MNYLLKPRNYDICFSIASLVLILVVLIIHYSEETYSSKQRHIFGALVLDALMINAAGLLHNIWIQQGLRSVISYDANRYVVIAEKAFTYMLPYFSIIYVMAIFHIEPDTLVKKAVILVPTIFALMLIFSGVVSEFIYHFTANGKLKYSYPQGAFVNIGVALYFIFATYLLIRYCGTLSTEKAIALWLYYLLMLGGIPIRIITKSSSIFEFSVSIALLLCVYTFQNPSEFMDRMSGAGTKNALDFTIMTNLLQKKKFTLLGIRIDRLPVIMGGESYDVATDILKQISLYLKQLGSDKALYYPDPGEFVILFNGISPDEDVITKTVEQIRKRFRDPWKLKGEDVRLYESPYVLGFPEEIDSLERYGEVKGVLGKALQKQSRDILRLSDLNLKVVEHDKKIDSIVKRALDDGLLEVFYQPIYCPSTGKFSSCEALLRLKDPQLGYISPAIFMPIAERNGTILAIDRFVLATVCEMLATTDARKYGLDYAEVNLSVVDCIQTNLADSIFKILDKYGVQPKEINLEITETYEPGITSVMNDNINKLMAEGFSFSMDDFGTGYSNIARIASMPVKLFKLDKSIIQSAFDSEVSYMVMFNMIKIIKALGREIVAEGVETGEQARQIIKLGCDHVQGFFYARPMPRDQFIEFLRDHNG